MKEPNRVSLSELSKRVESDASLREGVRFYSEDGLVLSLGMQRAIRSLLRPQSPYLVDDYRCGLVVSGILHGRANLMEYTISAGTLVYITPGSFLEPLDISDDLHIVGMGVSQEVFLLANRGDTPSVFNGRLKHGIHQLGESDIAVIVSSLDLFWDLLHTDKVSKDTKYCMVSTILNIINDMCTSGEEGVSMGRTSANDIFDRFIHLVNVHARRERHLSFYADKLCITERYLGSVVRSTSGITAKEWIDRAVMTTAKVMLRHGNMQVAKIADELNFPNASFFCKYFRRLEGCTPQDFRKG